MPVKNIIIGILLVVTIVLSIGSAQATKSDDVIRTGNDERSESFFDRWFGRAEKTKVGDQRKTEDYDGEIKDRHTSAKKYKNKGKNHKDKSDFSHSERASIQNYYRHENKERRHEKSHKGHKGKKGKNLPYGLQKKIDRGGQLPPSWEDKVARGQVLDGETLRYSEHLPEELVRRLPSARDGEVIRRVGDKIVRVAQGNGTILDVIDLADVLLR